MEEITEKKVVLGSVLAGFALVGYVLNFHELTAIMIALLAGLFGLEGYNKLKK